MTKLWITLIGLLVQFAIPAFAAQEPRTADLDYSITDPRMEQFIREAFDRNPQLAQALAQYRAAIQKIPQVTALPEPMVTFTEFVRSPETRVGPQTYSLMFSQRFPWFGKLDLQGKVAVREASGIYEQYRALQRKLAAQVKNAFYELAYVDGAVEITNQEQLLLEHYEQLAETRYATGQGLQQGVIKIQAELTKILNRQELLGQQRTTAVARLNTLRSMNPAEPVASIRLSDLMPADPAIQLNPDALYSTAEASRPEFRSVLDDIEKNELNAELAKKGYWPDVTVSAGMVNVQGREDAAGKAAPPPDNGKNVYSVAVGINIPLRRDKYRAAQLAASERVRAAQERYRSLLNEVKFDIRDQVNRIETLVRQMDLYERVLVPQTESALASTESAYETGQVGALDLLDSERVLLDIRLAQARLGADYMKALAQLELALGTRFPGP